MLYARVPPWYRPPRRDWVYYMLTLLAGWLLSASATNTPPATNADIRSMTASSTLQGNESKFGAANLHDADLTSWCEGKPDDGIGETITIVLARQVRVDTIYFVNGFGQSKNHHNNNRVKELAVNGHVIQLTDSWMEPSSIALKEPIVTDRLTLEIRSVFKGDKWSDTCLTEVGFEPYPWIFSELNPFGPLVYKNFSGDFPDDGDSLRTYEKGEVMIGIDGCGDGSCTHKSFRCKSVGSAELQCGAGIVLSIKNGRLFFNGKLLDGP
jgi:hypothetical protein